MGTPSAAAEQVRALVANALRADAAGDRSADTLYAPGATVIANARHRLAAPRFAGVGPTGGRVVVASLLVEVEGRFAWASADYRWLSADAGLAEVGRATFICQRRPEGWRLLHVHSSQLLPWDRPPGSPRP